jgi:hypothetical protein
LNIADAQDLFEKEIFERYGPSAVNISRKPGGYLDEITNRNFKDFHADLNASIDYWFTNLAFDLRSN